MGAQQKLQWEAARMLHRNQPSKKLIEEYWRWRLNMENQEREIQWRDVKPQTMELKQIQLRKVQQNTRKPQVQKLDEFQDKSLIKRPTKQTM